MRQFGARTHGTDRPRSPKKGKKMEKDEKKKKGLRVGIVCSIAQRLCFAKRRENLEGHLGSYNE
jgi:hypothetical protein